VNTAESESEPTGSADVTREAAPELTVWGLPMSVAPLRNCTVPVMVPATPDVTVAFNVTEVPKVVGLAGDGVCSVVVVADAPELMVYEASPVEPA
jgi:hypothetical protein